MKDNFKQCLEMLLEHEGGFVNHPRDPAGMTNLGITKKVYEEYLGHAVTEIQMRSLDKETVAPIYKSNYWDRIKGDALPSGVDWSVFDWAVNSGNSRAAKALQTIVGAQADGAIGSKTLAAVEAMKPKDIINEMYKVRQKYYESLPTFDVFGRGWSRRNYETLVKALEMA